MLLLLLLTLINLFLSKLFWLLQTYLFPINQKTHFSKTILGFPKMDIEKYVQNWIPQKSLPKKSFFLC